MKISFKNPSRFLVLSTIMLILFCSVKAPGQINQGIQKANNLSDISTPENFDRFLKRFNADPNFQLSRVKFPFKITEYPDEGEKPTPPRFLSKKDWEHIKLQQKGETIIRRQTTDKTSVIIKLMVEDTGIEVKHYFKCIKGRWWLVQLEDASD